MLFVVVVFLCVFAFVCCLFRVCVVLRVVLFVCVLFRFCFVKVACLCLFYGL